MNSSFPYSSHQCHVIHNKFPSVIGKRHVMLIEKFVVLQNYYVLRISWWVYFWWQSSWGLHLHFVILRSLLSEWNYFENHTFIPNTLPKFSSQKSEMPVPVFESPNSRSLFSSFAYGRMSFFLICLFTYVLTTRNDDSVPMKLHLRHLVDNDSHIALFAVALGIKLEEQRNNLHCSFD